MQYLPNLHLRIFQVIFHFSLVKTWEMVNVNLLGNGKCKLINTAGGGF